MTQKLKFASLILLAATACLAPAARADEADKETTLTFSQPVEIPGKVLPAGSYVFKLADTQANLNVVQVFTADQKHLIATLQTVSDSRQEPTGKTVVTFEERAAGAPEALHTWFYPGDIDGFEFVYPKANQQPAPAPTAGPAPAAAQPEN